MLHLQKIKEILIYLNPNIKKYFFIVHKKKKICEKQLNICNDKFVNENKTYIPSVYSCMFPIKKENILNKNHARYFSTNNINEPNLYIENYSRAIGP